MRKKEHNKKSFFRRRRQTDTEDEFQIIRDDELFEDVADYDEESAESDDEPADDPTEQEFSDDIENSGSKSGDEPGEMPEDQKSEDVIEGSEEKEMDIVQEPEESTEGTDDAEPEEPEKKSEDDAGPEEPEKKSEDDAGSEEVGKGSEPEDEREEEQEESEAEESEDDEADNDETDGDSDELDDVDIEEINLDDEDEEREPTEAEIAFKKHRRKKRALIAVFSVIGVIVAVYLGASVYFFSHFYYNTTINGADVSLNTVSQVQEHMEGEVAGYSLTLVELGGKEESIFGTDISLKYVKDDSLDKLLEDQNPFLWVTAFWQPPEIEASVGVEYDEEKLNTEIAALRCMNPEEQTPSVSARPEFKDTQFEIKEEELGTQIDNEKFVKAVNEAVSGFMPELDLEDEDCYIPPVFTSESPEVAAARDAMNSYLGANITLDFTPYTEVVDASVISQWISVDENMQVTFNQDSVRGYIASLAEKYDTYGRPRTFTTGFGNSVQIEGGSYGWQIDQEAEYNALTANIQNAETVTREPNYARRAATHEGNDFGGTYAEVDLTNQHMFYFQDGQCIMQSDVVTGNPNKGNATPQGVYTLAYKAPNQVLRGKKLPDGTYEYESPVSYWMPFNGGIGFHDATWQSAFGGSRYMTYGSHGCVNMPPSAAAQLYGLIQAGVPVVCHY